MPRKIAYHQILVSLSVIVTTKIKPQQEKLREGSTHTGPQIQAIIHQDIEITEGSATHLHESKAYRAMRKMLALNAFSSFDIVQNVRQEMMPLYKVDLSIFPRLA